MSLASGSLMGGASWFKGGEKRWLRIIATVAMESGGNPRLVMVVRTALLSRHLKLLFQSS